ncbi:MAG: universal stress protein [Solirubrobacterales bacterium]|nr:universal stress protein [Solirubrobacterales bacterium]MBV9164784.1 universal stress protein [Solirubrobacterales bacterium]MBV9536247.1 universal stress protein [Solirubrobacterales bacterium]
MGEVIVVGTDGSETAAKAVQEAIRVAKAFDAEVHIVSAYKPLHGAHVAGAPEGAAKVWQPLPDSRVEAVLAEAAAAVRLKDVPVKTHPSREEPADALLSVASETNADLIVVGNRGMHGARRVLGSVPNKVAHRAGCNVLIVSTT